MLKRGIQHVAGVDACLPTAFGIRNHLLCLVQVAIHDQLNGRATSGGTVDLQVAMHHAGLQGIQGQFPVNCFCYNCACVGKLPHQSCTCRQHQLHLPLRPDQHVCRLPVHAEQSMQARTRRCTSGQIVEQGGRVRTVEHHQCSFALVFHAIRQRARASRIAGQQGRHAA